MKNIIYSISLTVFFVILSGCASQGVKKSGYEEVSEGPVAKISFVNADPFYFKKGEPLDSLIVIANMVVGDYRHFLAALYEDNKICTDKMVFPVIESSDESFSIKADQLQTFEMSTIENYKKRIISCPARFSFVPEDGKKYIVKNSLHIQSVEYAYCQVQVFDSEGNSIDIIAREDEPTLWTSSSPRCTPSELDSPVKTKIAKQNFR